MSMAAFINGPIFDGARYLGRSAIVLIDDGRIVAVGELDVPADADVVDLDGGLLAPGFVDAHVHAVQGGLERTRCDLSEDSTREEYLATIKGYAETHPDRRWILGGGWAMAAFPGGTPTAADLDSIVPTVRCSCPTATTTAPGSTPARWRSPGSRARPPTHRTDTSSATPRVIPPAPSTRGHAHRRPARARNDAGGLLPRAAHRPGLPPLGGSHRLAGRHRRCLRRDGRPGSDVPARCAARPADRARGRCAVVGPGRGRGAGRLADGAAGRVHPGPVPADQRQGDAGRCR